MSAGSGGVAAAGRRDRYKQTRWPSCKSAAHLHQAGHGSHGLVYWGRHDVRTSQLLLSGMALAQRPFLLTEVASSLCHRCAESANIAECARKNTEWHVRIRSGAKSEKRDATSSSLLQS